MDFNNFHFFSCQDYGASTGGYNQGGYGAASYAPPQDYTYGRGTSYGQQDFNYPRNYGST